MRNDTTSFSPITRPARAYSEGQQARLERRSAERARKDDRRQDRNTKRAQAFA